MSSTPQSYQHSSPSLAGLVVSLALVVSCCGQLGAASDATEAARNQSQLAKQEIVVPGGKRAQVSDLDEFVSSTSGRNKTQPSQVAKPWPSEIVAIPLASVVASASPSIAASGHSRAGAAEDKAVIPQHWQVKSLLNVTHDYPLEYSQLICGYIWPLVALITTFTNLMIVFVLTQRDMRSPTNVVLTSIAIADIIPIVVPVPWFIYLFAMGNERQVLYPPVVCYIYQHSTRSVSEIFYFLSTWLNVLLAIQDYLCACWPQLAKRYCKIRVVVWQIVTLTLLAFVLNLPQALKLVFKPVKFFMGGELVNGCKRLQAKWFKDLIGEYAPLYDDVFTAIIVLFVDGGPALVLIVLTGLLIRQLKLQRLKGHMLMEQARTASRRRRELKRQQESEASAKVMIFVLIAFLAVKIPFATTYTLMIIQSRFDVRFVDNLLDFQRAISITDLVFVLSYPLNFTIFCLCSKKFRHKCNQLLADCRVRRQLRGSLSKQGSTSMSFESDRSVGSSVISMTDNNNIEAADDRQAKQTRTTDHAIQVAMSPARHQDDESTSRLLANQMRDSQILSARQNDLASMIQNGQLCYECIARYESLMRAEWTHEGVRRHSDSNAGGHPMAHPSRLHHVHDHHYDASGHHNLAAIKRNVHEWRQDASATVGHHGQDHRQMGAWPANPQLPYPPPPELRISQYDEHIPFIISNARDRSELSFDEDLELESVMSARSRQKASSTASGNRYSPGPAHAHLPELEVARNREGTSVGSNESAIVHCHSDIDETQSSRRKRMEADDREANAGHPGANGDGGSNERRLSLQKPADYGMQSGSRQFSGPAGSRHRKLTLGPIEITKPKSISLSNSKLSALPDATGLLADVMLWSFIGDDGRARPERKPSTTPLSRMGSKRSQTRGSRRRH